MGDTMLDQMVPLTDDELREILADHANSDGRCVGGGGCQDDGITGFNQWPCQTVRLVAMAASRANEAALREALEDLAKHGTRSDTMPTMPAGGRDTGWWYDYIGRADKRVRRRARAALDGAAAQTRG